MKYLLQIIIAEKSALYQSEREELRKRITTLVGLSKAYLTATFDSVSLKPLVDANVKFDYQEPPPPQPMFVNKINAIRQLREDHPILGLKEAKDVVDRILAAAQGVTLDPIIKEDPIGKALRS